jgi:pyruvate dehydrogenase E2 component (dihydrolipoamide acetyltransferase)
MPILEVVVPEEIGDVEQCLVVTWLKQEQDAVEQEETLVILQAEKVSFELPAPATGQVVAILALQGEVVDKGQVLARLEVASIEKVVPPGPAETMTKPFIPSPPSGEVRASPIAKRLAREHNVDLTQVTGSGGDGRITEKDLLAFIERQQEKPAKAPQPREIRASPVAKRLAREHNIDLVRVSGSGGGGRIVEKDVLAFIETQHPATVGSIEQQHLEPGVGQHPTEKKDERASTVQPSALQAGTVPLVGMRATIAQRMHDSLQGSAQVTLHTGADVTNLVAMRENLKQQASITYTDLVVRACALALRRHPYINATLDSKTIRLLSQVNIGLAIALDDGLVVPVIRNADQQSLVDLAQIRIRLTERAHAGQLTAEEMGNGTFTVTNLGNYDVDTFTPIINPPEAAILGVGRIVEKVVIHQGKIAQRAMMNLSLTFDHRLVDGAPAASFLQSIKHLLEMPDELET